MPGIFLSWSLPDKDRVLELRDRLRDLGFASGTGNEASDWRLWEYSEDMLPGAQIHDQVIAVINKVRLAIVCFSDHTADRDWIQTEVAWCVQRMKQPGSELKAIVPVWVGPHPANKLPLLVQQLNLPALDLSTNSQDQLRTLVDKVLDVLGDDAPQVMPAALFAMNDKQAEQLLGSWHTPAGAISDEQVGLQRLCSLLGMIDPPPLLTQLTERYGSEAEDFSPFESKKPIIRMIYDVVRRVNTERVAHNQRPLFLRWVQRDLAGLHGRDAEEKARDLWLSRQSLLVVDSVSASHPDIKSAVSILPPLNRAALLWIPPFTQHTRALEESLGTMVGFVRNLGDSYRQWEQQPERSVTFDVTTPLGIRLWLYRALTQIPSEALPLAKNLAALTPQAPTRVSLRDLMHPS